MRPTDPPSIDPPSIDPPSGDPSPIDPPGRAQRWDDCDADVRAWVERIVQALRDELGSTLEGVYLHGSLAAGCYHRPKSDVDLLVVVTERVPEDARRRLGLRLADLSDARPTVGDVELSVVQARHARAFTHPMPFELHYGGDWTGAIRRGEIDFAADRADGDLAAHVTFARARGVALLGPPPRAAFAPVPWSDFVDSVMEDFAWIVEDDHVLESPFYAVLNACRVLQLLTEGEGTVASKDEGALWALAHLPPGHRPIVARALEVYRSSASVSPDERRTGGREWDADALRRFRDYVAGEVARLRAIDGATDG